MDNETLEDAPVVEAGAEVAAEGTQTVEPAGATVKRPAKAEVEPAGQAEAVPATTESALRTPEKRVETAEQLTRQQGSELLRYRVLELARDEAVRLGLSFEAGALADAFALGMFASVKAGDDGGLTGMETALTALKENRPYLLKARTRDKPAAPDIDALARGGKGNPLETAAARAAARGLMRGF